MLFFILREIDIMEVFDPIDTRHLDFSSTHHHQIQIQFVFIVDGFDSTGTVLVG